jgi:hypothetical protein
MLPDPVDVQVVDGKLSLPQAADIARAKIRELHGEAMLLAWFSQETGEYSPAIPC